MKSSSSLSVHYINSIWRSIRREFGIKSTPPQKKKKKKKFSRRSLRGLRKGEPWGPFFETPILNENRTSLMTQEVTRTFEKRAPAVSIKFATGNLAAAKF